MIRVRWLSVLDCLDLIIALVPTTCMDMEQQTGSKYEKEYVKAVYCHPAYLTYMHSTS